MLIHTTLHQWVLYDVWMVNDFYVFLSVILSVFEQMKILNFVQTSIENFPLHFPLFEYNTTV